MIELETTTLSSDVDRVLDQTRVTVRTLIVDFSAVPGEESLSYAHGFYRGWCGDDVLANGRSAKRGFSDRYLSGYKMGQKVNRGDAPMPPWASEED